MQLECVADTANALGRALLDKCCSAQQSCFVASQLASHTFIPFFAVITLTAETVSALHRTHLYVSTHTHDWPYVVQLSLKGNTQIAKASEEQILLIKLRMLF